jgi:hypothetical protein
VKTGLAWKLLTIILGLELIRFPIS